MPNANEQTLYQEQKKTRPAIETIIPAHLGGEKQKAALDFVAYLRENKMPPAWASGNSWKSSYKGKGVCYIKLDQQGKGTWKIEPLINASKAYEDFVEAENLRDIIWRNLALCTRCHPNTCAPKGMAETFSGVKKLYFGKAFDNVCRGGDTSFRNPDEEAIQCVKKLLDFRRRAIEGHTVPMTKYVSAKRRISQTEVITLAKEIRVAGLSLAKAGWPHKTEKAGDLWRAYSDEQRMRINAKSPIVDYGIWHSVSGAEDYIAGSEVDAFEGIDDAFVTFTIPAGQYIKDTFNAFDYEDLVTGVLPKRKEMLRVWAKANGIAIAGPSMFIEVYPVQEMIGSQGETTSGHLKSEDRFKARYPKMYTLLSVE